MGAIVRNHKAFAHVLAIPFSTQGHVTPMLRFATQLARKNTTVTFVCFEDAIPGLTALIDDASSELQSLDFRFISLHRHRPAADPLDVGNVLKEAFQPLMETLIHDKSTSIAGPTCIISDMFLPWTLDVAEKLQIPRYMLVPSGVIFARLMQGSIDCFEHGQFQTSETNGKLVEFDWLLRISALPPLRYYELDATLRNDPAGFRVSAESMTKSAGVLVNSFFELEETVVEVFRSSGLPDQHPGNKGIEVCKIYPVGPLFSTTALTDCTSVHGLEDSSSRCLRWLGTQPSSSVLYVAFGSQARLRPEQINELAHGLEASTQHFLWLLPQSKDETSSITEVLPPGFEARVSDRGCIVTGWAPQLQILAHSSTGGFLTHSGWNSSLESVVCGVPMICWPQTAEQHLNCRYFVDDLKVGEQLQTGKENILKRSEVERAVRLLMVEVEGRAIKSRVEELKRKAAAAVGEGGSQSRFLQEFLDDILVVTRCHQSSEELRTNAEQIGNDGRKRLNWLAESED